MRKADLFLLWLVIGLGCFGLLFADAHFRRGKSLPLIDLRSAMVERLQLTDLCLFTEARYTRHLSQADLHTPFQDSPMSVEHFPAGSLAGPPKRLRELHDKVD